MRKICWSPGLRPGPRWGNLQRSPRPPSWWRGAPRGLCCSLPKTPLTILSLCLSCVYVHTCMKMHCYFVLNVKQGPHSCTWGASNYLAPALVVTRVKYRFVDFCFYRRCTTVQSAVLRLHVVRLSVCDVGGSGPHRLEILETDCTVN